MVPVFGFHFGIWHLESDYGYGAARAPTHLAIIEPVYSGSSLLSVRYLD
jgi:hypothetical protein